MCQGSSKRGGRARCLPFPGVSGFGFVIWGLGRQFIDYKTSMITDEDPLRGLLFYWDLGFSHTTRLGVYTMTVR